MCVSGLVGTHETILNGFTLDQFPLVYIRAFYKNWHSHPYWVPHTWRDDRSWRFEYPSRTIEKHCATDIKEHCISFKTKYRSIVVEGSLKMSPLLMPWAARTFHQKTRAFILKCSLLVVFSILANKDSLFPSLSLFTFFLFFFFSKRK